MILAARRWATTVAPTAAPATSGEPVAISAPSPIIRTSPISIACTGLGREFFDRDHVVLGDLVLLAAGSDHRKHVTRQYRSPGPAAGAHYSRGAGPVNAGSPRSGGVDQHQPGSAEPADVVHRLAADRGAVGDPRAAFRTINHELHSAIPLPASAENLQEDFSSRLNKGPSTNCLAGSRRAGAVYGSQSSMASASSMSSSSSSTSSPAVKICSRLPRATFSLAVPAVRTKVS